MTPLRPVHFIDDPITVEYNTPPPYEKAPPCPNRLVWNGQTIAVVELLEEWVDFTRRGRFARNMQPQHAQVASRRGSWGVGRYSFRVRVAGGRIFEIYYDRAPKNVDDRKGSWVLRSELVEEPAASAAVD